MGVVERSVKKAGEVYSEIRSYDSVEELLADPAIELVVVNTPNNTHFEFAKQALLAGKHVLVEKPFTVTQDEARELFTLAKKMERHVLPYQNRRYDTDFQSVKEVVDSGKLGELVEVHIRYDRYKIEIGQKAAKETPVPGSGLLYDLGPHLVDAAIDLFGVPKNWKIIKGQFRPQTKVDDYAQLHLEYASGLQVYLTASLLVVDLQPAFVLHGTKGSFIKHRTDIQEAQLQQGLKPTDPDYGQEPQDSAGVLTTIENGQRTQTMIHAPRSSYMQLFDAVYDTIRNKIPYPVQEAQVIKQLEIISRDC